MLIDVTYFTGDLFIPNLGANKSSIVSSNADFQYFIDTWERDMLIKALGITLYNEFISHVDSSGNILPGVDQKWADLLNGTTYDTNKVWRGLRYTQGTQKLSMMAYYVFNKYWEQRHLQRTTLGMVQADAENSKVFSPNFLLVSAWRNMLEWYGSGKKCYRGRTGSNYVDLYTFLSDNESKYVGWYFTLIGKKNRWSI